MGAGIAQWLERRTRDWKVAGSNPCWNGRRIFFSRVDFLRWLLFRYPFHPRVTTVARKKSRSFCQKCRWQVTAKHAYTLHMWLLLNRASALVTTCPSYVKWHLRTLSINSSRNIRECSSGSERFKRVEVYIYLREPRNIREWWWHEEVVWAFSLGTLEYNGVFVMCYMWTFVLGWGLNASQWQLCMLFSAF